MKEIHKISMWRDDKRVFSSTGTGVYEKQFDFISTLTPEQFGYEVGLGYNFTIDYILRSSDTPQRNFKQRTINTAAYPEVNE